MSKVFSAHAVSVDGYITGRDPRAGRGLGDGGMLFDWYGDGDTASQVFDGFRLSEPSARVFDALATRVGAVVTGRNTYEDSENFGGGSPHPGAPLVLLSHRPAPEISERQTLVTTGIEDAIAAARQIAGNKDVGLMGGGVATAALAAGLVDEVVLHQIPILLGGGRPFFQELPEHVRLRLVEAVPAPGVTHLRYEVIRGSTIPARRTDMLKPDVRQALDSTSLAHLATVLPDGSPHSVPLFIGTFGDKIVFLTGPHSRKARNLRRDSRVALSLTSADNPFEPVVVRGRVIEWLEGDAAWEIIDQLAMKYTGQPYSRELERVVAVVEPETQTVGTG